MRYRLMASYLGASYQAAVGPSDRDVTLFAAPPPPEEHGFSPAPGGIWRKQVRLDEIDGLWESRPIGSYHGEPCLVLDDLGDRLHIVYLGMDERRAAQLGYWAVDRGVFEVVVPRYDVTDLAEERHEFPVALLLSALPAASPRALGSGEPAPAGPGPSGPGALGIGPNGAGMAPQGVGRAIGAIGPGSAGPGGALMPGAAAAGMGPGAAGQGPGGMAEWNGQAGAPQRAQGQLPTPMSQQPAPASVQQPVTGAYYSPVGATFNGVARPPAPGLPSPPNGLAAPGGFQPANFTLSGGQQLPGGQQGAGLAGVPAGQFAAAPGQNGQGATGTQQYQGVAPPPAMQLPPGRQLPAAQAPAQQQQAQQFLPVPSLPAAPPPAAGPQGTGPQPTTAPPANPQAPQPAGGQAVSAQAPTTAAAWHGSPAADGNGTWYFQPAPEAQQNGAPATGYAFNGLGPNGYAQQDQGSAPAPSPNGFGGLQQYPQPAQPAPVAGYQQAPALPPPLATGQQAQPGQPAQSGMQGLSSQPPQGVPPAQAAQPAPAAAGPQFATPSAPPAPQAPQAPQVPQAPSAPPAAAPAGTAEQTMPGGPVADGAVAAPVGPPAPQAPVAPAGPPAALPGPAPAPPAPATAQAGPVTAPRSVPVPAAPPPVGPPQQPAAPQPIGPQPAVPQSTGPQPTTPEQTGPQPAAQQPAAQQPLSAPLPTAAAPQEAASATGPLMSLPPASQSDQGTHSGLTAVGALSKLTGAVRGRRAARKPRLSMSAIFADLVDMADIPRSAYAVDEEVTGAMCLFKTDGGYEVFSCAEDARHEVRFFEEEEAAYFYLFGVLAAEALRNGRLAPRRS